MRHGRPIAKGPRHGDRGYEDEGHRQQRLVTGQRHERKVGASQLQPSYREQ